MDWVFIAFAIGTLVYALFIIKHHMLDVRIQTTLYRQMLMEREELEQQLDVQNTEIETLEAQIKEAQQAFKELQGMSKDHQGQIRVLEEEMAKRGKYRIKDDE